MVLLWEICLEEMAVKMEGSKKVIVHKTEMKTFKWRKVTRKFLNHFHVREKEILIYENQNGIGHNMMDELEKGE